MNTLTQPDALFLHDDQPIRRDTFLESYRRAGIQRGDTLFVHSDLSGIGRLAMSNTNQLMGQIIDSLKEAVGPEGTLIMPAFSYSFMSGGIFGDHEAFDVNKTPARTGVLTDYFWKQPGTYRTDHPTHSVAIWGWKADQYANIGKTTFDRDSVWGKIHDENALLVFLGVPVSACTFIHYVEKQCNIPYRHAVELKGTVYRDRKPYQKEITFFQLDRKYSLNRRLLTFLNGSDAVQRAALGGSEVTTIRAQAYFETASALIRKNPYYFVTRRTLAHRALAKAARILQRMLGR
jgi:aminoglycoside 3-N-acetyltransferase